MVEGERTPSRFIVGFGCETENLQGELAVGSTLDWVTDNANYDNLRNCQLFN